MKAERVGSMSVKINIWMGDITTLAVDAIVNAANKTLLGGGGVDGAIHRAAGPDLLKETRELGGAETGEAKLTKGYHLPATYVIHTVGPVYQGGKHGEADLLAASYRNSLAVAEEHQLKTIAFPAISTGVYGYPLEPATQIAIQTIQQEIPNMQHIKEIFFVVFDQETYSIYENIFQQTFGRDFYGK